MGKVFLLAIGVGLGYTFGFRDAHEHKEHIVTRVVDHVRTSMGRPGADIDSLMNRLEGGK